MAAFFVTGSGTDIGKTYICAGLLGHWRALGLEAAAIKPVVSGFDEANPAGSDPAVLLDALGLPTDSAAIAAIAPFRLRAPLSPDQAARLEGRVLSLDLIAEACRDRMGKARGPLLVEGAGGAMSPICADRTMLDLAKALAMPIIFVAGSYLGAISHALTGLETLKGRGLSIAAVIVNESVQDSVGLEQTLASLKSQFADAPMLGVARGAGEKAWPAISAALGVSPV